MTSALASRRPPHWTTRFMAVGYAAGAQGPDRYDCWSFARWVQKEQFGRDVPFAPSPNGVRAILREVPAIADLVGWQPTEFPRDGDGVLMACLQQPTHVGVYVGDLEAVLHCDVGGPRLHDRRHLQIAGWRVRGFFTPAG